jgi:hypothetical protein
MESINYSNFIESCNTGDLLLYTSKKWYSYIIEFLGWSKYSHVSMIIKDPIWINPQLKGLYIFESGAEDVPDVLDDKKVYGVQLVKLEDALKYYNNNSNGIVYYIKNQFDRNEKTIEINNKLEKIITKNDDKPYDINLIDWIAAKFKIHLVHRETIRFFCSALVGYTLTQLNMLDENTDWTIITPKEYSYYEHRRLEFKNCLMEPEKLIVFSQET